MRKIEKTCSSCDQPFEAKKSNATYCSGKCRERASRRRRLGGGGASIPDTTGVAAMPPSAPIAGGLVTATTALLTGADRVDSPAGQAAIALATRIDNPAGETGSSLAALVREHRAALAEAVRDAPSAADGLDELSRRRLSKASGA